MTEESAIVVKRPHRLRRALLFLLGALLGLVLVLAASLVIWQRTNDKPASLTQTDDISAPVDVQGRSIPDYFYAFAKLQERELASTDENGWRLILEAFGPRALNFEASTPQQSWQDFLADSASEEWRRTVWQETCDKMKVDSEAEPAFYGQPDVIESLAQSQNVGTVQAAFDLCQRYFTQAWTQEDCPELAQWLEENAEQLALASRAARMPKFVCWRVVSEYPRTFWGLNCFNAHIVYRLGQSTALRATYRIGAGDVSGALDDVETILRLSAANLTSECATSTELILGHNLQKLALNIPIFSNLDAQPTGEEYARYVELASTYASDEILQRAQEIVVRNDCALNSSIVVDCLRARREWKGLLWPLREALEIDENARDERLVATAQALIPLDDAQVVKRFQERFKHEDGESRGLFCEDVADTLNDLLVIPLDFRRHQSFNLAWTRMARIGQALLAYQSEHGTLPPAFSVDADGKPLHSWRVLILPYLGEQERALYEQIHLDEPWDSAYNSRFFEQRPSAYQSAFDEEDSKELTRVTTLLGDGLLFDDSGVGKDWRASIAQFGSESCEQCMVFERKEPINWMKPDAEIQCSQLQLQESTLSDAQTPGASVAYAAEPSACGALADVLYKREGVFVSSRCIGGGRAFSQYDSFDELERIFRGSAASAQRP